MTSHRDAIYLAMTVLKHTDRLRFLEACSMRATSVSMIAEDKQHLTRLAYHVRWLRDERYITKTDERKVRAAVETYYRLAPKGTDLMRQLGLNGCDAGS